MSSLQNKILMMRYTFLLFVCFLFSCGPSIRYFDYDTTAKFTQYSSYNYFEEMPKLGMSELDAKRLFIALDVQLPLNGLTMSSTPDLLVNIITDEEIIPQQNTVGVGVGGGSGGFGGGVSIGIPIGGDVPKQIIRFELVEAATNKLVWQTDVEVAIRANTNPESRQALLHSAVKKALSKYPPVK